MKIFSPYMIWKNILEKEFTTGISHSPAPVKKPPNTPRHVKNNSVQNQGHKQHATANTSFQKATYGNIVYKVIYGNIVNMMLKIIEHPIYNTIVKDYQAYSQKLSDLLSKTTRQMVIGNPLCHRFLKNYCS